MDTLIIFCAEYVPLFVVLALGIAWLLQSKNTKLQFFVAIILAGIFSIVMSRIASKLYFHPRPFAVEHIKPLIAHSADNGFPSDHALFTGTLTAIAYLYNKKIAFVMAGLTLLVGVARILAHIHSPLDIVGGWAIGAFGAWLAYMVARRFITSKTHDNTAA